MLSVRWFLRGDDTGTSGPAFLRLTRRKPKRESVPWSDPSRGINGCLGPSLSEFLCFGFDHRAPLIATRLAGCGAAVACLSRKEEVVSSILTTPTILDNGDSADKFASVAQRIERPFPKREAEGSSPSRRATGASSNGRIPDFDSGGFGSNPNALAIFQTRKNHSQRRARGGEG